MTIIVRQLKNWGNKNYLKKNKRKCFRLLIFILSLLNSRILWIKNLFCWYFYNEEGKNLEIVKDESIYEDKLINMNSIDLVKSVKDIYNKGNTLYVLELVQEQHLIKEKKLSANEVLKIINKNKE